MSYKIVDEAINDPRPKGTEKFVLIIIAQHADDRTRECFPSIDTIAEKAGLGRSTVKRLLANLRKNGLIETVRRHNKSSITRIPEGPNRTPQRAQIEPYEVLRAQIEPLKVSNRATESIKSGRLEGPNRAPNRSGNQSLNQSENQSKRKERSATPPDLSPELPPELPPTEYDEAGFPIESKPVSPSPERSKPSRPKRPTPSRGTLDQCKAYAVERGATEEHGEDFFDKMEAGGWTRGKAALKNWQAHMRTYIKRGWLLDDSRKKNSGGSINAL